MRLLAVSFLVAACSAGSAPTDAEADLTVVATLGPQSIAHATISSPELSFAFNGNAGDIVAPDVWPTGRSALTPTLVLLGPKGKSGHRSQIATGAARGGDGRHLAIDGFTLPQSGSYLIVVGKAAGSKGGQVTVRLWTSASHAPRQESSQVDLTLRVSAAAQAVVSDHLQRPRAWGDGEVDSIISGIQQQPDPIVAISDAQALLWSLAQAEGSAAQLQRAHDAAAALPGTQAHFRSLDASVQVFALWWLDGLLFTSQQPKAPPAAVTATIDDLVAAWPGAAQDAGSPTVAAKLLGSAIYGYQVDWSATQSDTDGKPVFIDSSREWFDSRGGWLGEQSDGASEPDDD
ncbi:MAG TPA: hypothetical protein VLW85_13700 [Myxococcales bacterium]|nr:hypothetical protein [Myxococcales bacterium]